MNGVSHSSCGWEGCSVPSEAVLGNTASAPSLCDQHVSGNSLIRGWLTQTLNKVWLWSLPANPWLTRNTRGSVKGAFPQIVDKLIQEVNQPSQTLRSSVQVFLNLGKSPNDICKGQGQQGTTTKRSCWCKWRKLNHSTLGCYISKNKVNWEWRLCIYAQTRGDGVAGKRGSNSKFRIH